MTLADLVVLSATITLGLTAVGVLLVIASMIFAWYRPLLIGVFATMGGVAGTIALTFMAGILSLSGATL